MKKSIRILRHLVLTATGPLLLAACATSTLPTLVEVARIRQNGVENKDNPNLPYKLTDRDVLDYTDRVKIILGHRFSAAAGVRYSSSFGQASLTALAAAASTAGWSVAAASGLGAGSSFISGLGTIFNAKGDAEAYESAFVTIQQAETSYYFAELGGTIATDKNGKKTAVFANKLGSGDIPKTDVLTPDGETLYYRVASNLKLLEDALQKKIPDLQTLKDAKGDTSPTSTPPPPVVNPTASTSRDSG